VTLEVGAAIDVFNHASSSWSARSGRWVLPKSTVHASAAFDAPNVADPTALDMAAGAALGVVGTVVDGDEHAPASMAQANTDSVNR
jgi:hypothetical protein